MSDTARHENPNVRHENARQLVSWLARARASAKEGDALLAFDADGTLWAGDVGNDLFEALVETNGVREQAHHALIEEARAFGLATSGTPTDVARRLYAAHNAGTYPEGRAFAMMAWVFAGFSPEEARQFSQHVIDTTNLASRLHQFLAPVLDWARAEGVATWIVSASPKWMVELGVALLGIAPEYVVGMTPRVHDGRIEPVLEGPPTYGPSKLIALRAVCPGGTILSAFGDSASDLALLSEAHVSVAIRPKADLLARAAEVRQLFVIND